MGEVTYFDNAATTFPKPECVYKRMDEANRNYAVNSGRGAYALGVKVASIMEDTRNRLLKLTEVEKVAEVVLTASATLACNQIFGGIEWKKEDVVYVSPFEHNATMRTIHKYQKEYGFEVEELAFNDVSLELDIEKVKFQFLRKKPTHVVMSHVSNVTGYILPIGEVATEAKAYDAMVIVDGAQALGLVPVSLKRIPIDFYIFAGHKTLYGALGVGGFIQNCNYKLKHFLSGGTGSDSLNLETTNYEPGSPNIVAIAALNASLEEIERITEEHSKTYLLEQEQELSEYLIEKLQDIPGINLYLPNHLTNHAGIVSFNIDGYKAADVGMILDQDYNIAVRTGYQCAPLIHEHLGVYDFAGVVRASLGRFTTKEEIDELSAAVREIAEG